MLNAMGCPFEDRDKGEMMTGSQWRAIALKVLRHVEWRGWDRHEEFCAWCGHDRAKGHEPDCVLAKLLAEAGAVEEKEPGEGKR